jgi:hypothetical protein
LYARSIYKFEQSAKDDRVHYEPGAAAMAEAVSEQLSGWIDRVEHEEYQPFKNARAITVYVFDDKQRYANFSHGSVKSRGSSSSNEIYLSPRLRERPGSLARIVLHELSHVHTRQYTGTWRYVTDIPGWFVEGMAVVTSHGGGAENVTEQQAVAAIRGGHHFMPRDRGGLFGHYYASDYDLSPHMYYQQAGLFVRFLQQRDAETFHNCYIDLLKGKAFANVWQDRFGLTIAQLWDEFVYDNVGE